MANPAIPETDFKLITTEGYQFKVLSELLNNNLVEANFVFDQDGIHLREANEKETVLIDIRIYAENLQYEPPAETMFVGFTCQHLYKMLRRIKKKDKLVIYKLKGSDELSFNILNADKDRDKDASIRIKDVKHSEWDMPEYPRIPVTAIPASEYQRMTKEMSTASKQITAKVQKSGVMFLGGTPQLYAISDKYGSWADDGEVTCSKTFDSKQLASLSKCSGLATNNYLKLFSNGEENPLKITSCIGSIGVAQFCVDVEKTV